MSCAQARNPSYRWNCVSAPPRPISSSWCTARGVRPSPHVFSRGNVLPSTTTTSCPARASEYAVAAPAGPAPTTRTSWVRVVLPADRVAILVEGRLRALGDGDEVGLSGNAGEDFTLVPHDLGDLQRREIV